MYEDSMAFEGNNVDMAVDEPDMAVSEPLTQGSNLDEKYKYQCAHCDRRFRWKSCLTVHTKTHAPKYCDICEKGFLKWRYYRDHLQSLSHKQKTGLYEELEQNKCDECNKTFANERALSRHILRHRRSDRPLKKCSMCDFTTVYSSSFNRHMRAVHTNERKYVCEECDASFKAASGLRDHKLFVHSTERNFSCNICGRSFKVRTGLTRHLKCHAEDRPAKCFCGLAFKLVSNLRKHQVRSHGRVTVIKKVGRR